MKKLLPRLIMVAFMLTFAGQASAAPVPLALDPLNVADEGFAVVYETTGGGLVTLVSNANDTEFTGNINNNLLTITGAFLGIQINLTGPTNLTELGTYVDPLGFSTDSFKNTDSVEFLISTDFDFSYTSVGLGSFAHGALPPFSYVNVIGNFPGVTNVRYRFHQGNSGSEGQRIAEVIALQNNDDDGDGVVNADDVCQNTINGAVVDNMGCSIAQLCPAEPDDWKNHGKYVSCVAHAADDFVDAELITEEEKDAIVSEAGQSNIGKKKK